MADAADAAEAEAESEVGPSVSAYSGSKNAKSKSTSKSKSASKSGSRSATPQRSSDTLPSRPSSDFASVSGSTGVTSIYDEEDSGPQSEADLLALFFPNL